MARPHIEPFCDRDEAFKKLVLPGLNKGMRYKMLSFDDDTGAIRAVIENDLVTKWKAAGDSILGARFLARGDAME